MRAPNQPEPAAGERAASLVLAAGPGLAACRRWLAVEFVAAERVDVRVRDRRDAAERLVIGDDVGGPAKIRPKPAIAL